MFSGCQSDLPDKLFLAYTLTPGLFCFVRRRNIVFRFYFSLFNSFRYTGYNFFFTQPLPQ